MLLLLAGPSTLRVHQQVLSSQMLLAFTKASSAAVRERALGRIRTLSHLLTIYPSLKVRTRHLPARPSSIPCPARQLAAQRCLQGKPGHRSGCSPSLCADAAVLVHGLLSPAPLCQEPALSPVLSGMGQPKERGGSPGLAAFPAWGCCPARAALGDGAIRALQSSDLPAPCPGHALGYRALAQAAAPQLF